MSDKSGHSIGYALLAVVLLRAFARGRLSGVTWTAGLAAIGLATMYGVSDEFHQSFVQGRHGTPVDVLIDAVGVALAIALHSRRRATARE